MIEPEHILDIVCDIFKISIDSVKSSKRDRKFVRCRKAFSIICRKKLDLSFHEIGVYINKTKSQICIYVCSQPMDEYYTSRLNFCYKKVDELFN